MMRGIIAGIVGSRIYRIYGMKMLHLHSLGSRSYYTLPSLLAVGELGPKTGELRPDAGELGPKTGELRPDVGELKPETGELGPDAGELPNGVRYAIERLGKRPRQEQLRPVIHAICAQGRWVTSAEISKLLNLRQRNLTAGHLSPMVESGIWKGASRKI